MAKHKINKYIGAFALGAVIMAIPSCSDTWDSHYGTVNEESEIATQTLWEQIQSNPNLSRFATIAQRAKYYRDETHPIATYTFADILKSNRVTTVWAPENSCFTDAEYNTWLERCETDGYNVQQQLLGNHIALWRHVLSGDSIDTLKMINSKNLIFDRKARTLQGRPIHLANIKATNGTLHTITGGTTPFDWNFYEYIKFAGTLPVFRDYILSKDTTYFVPGSSIEGLPDENGNPTYVDSVYYTSNQLFRSRSYLPPNNSDLWMMADEGFGANLEAEDSMFIMLLPTDAAWAEAKEKLSQYYIYSPIYSDKQKGNNNSPNQTEEGDPDSLQKMSLEMDLISPLVFNIHKQPKIGGQKTGTPWTMEYFIETKGAEAEYLLNTYGDTLRATDLWDQTTLFNGKVFEMSNGYGYEIEHWNFPSHFYKPDVEVEMTGSVFYNYANNYTGTARRQTFSNAAYADVVAQHGKVSRNDFYVMGPQGTGTNPKGEVKLKGNFNEAYVPNAEVMSGTYDLYLVMVPYYYIQIAGGDTLITDTLANKINLQISYNNGVARDATSNRVTVTYDGVNVDTLLCIPDFTFPYSYKNLRHSYPTLIIQGAPTSSEIRSGKYTRTLCIDRIILRSKENQSTIEIDPNDTADNEN